MLKDRDLEALVLQEEDKRKILRNDVEMSRGLRRAVEETQKEIERAFEAGVQAKVRLKKSA